jgi:hypothetical protein
MNTRKTERRAKQSLQLDGGARRTLCAIDEHAQNGARREAVLQAYVGARRTLCACIRRAPMQRPPLGLRTGIDKLPVLADFRLTLGSEEVSQRIQF